MSLEQLISSNRNKTFIHKFNPNLYDKAPWLCGCSQSNAFFCFPCLLYGGNVSWTKNGIRDLNHLSQKIEKHKFSNLHLHNMLNLSILINKLILVMLHLFIDIMTSRLKSSNIIKNYSELSVELSSNIIKLDNVAECSEVSHLKTYAMCTCNIILLKIEIFC